MTFVSRHNWTSGVLGTGSTYKKLDTSNELPSITFTFDPPLYGVLSFNFAALGGRWSRMNNNAQLRIKYDDENGVRVGSSSENVINGTNKTITQVFKNSGIRPLSNTTINGELRGVTVASMNISTQKTRRSTFKFDGMTNTLGTGAQFAVTQVSPPSIDLVSTGSDSVSMKIANGFPSDTYTISGNGETFENLSSDSEVIVDGIGPNSTQTFNLFQIS